MADRVKVTIAVVPIETVGCSPEQGSKTIDMIATEIGKSLSASVEASVANYGGSAADQGYKDGVVNYKEAPDGAGGEVAISGETTASFVFIKNTGFVFSSPTVLGVAETSRLLKVTTNAGAIILAVLAAGEGIPFKALQNAGTIDASGIEIETVDSNGSEASGGVHLAVEYLVVD